MMPFLAEASALLTQVFVAGLWQGLALAVMGVALCSLLSRASARLRHSLLVVLFTVALVLPWLHLRRTAPAAQSYGLFVAQWVAAGIALLWFAACTVRAVQLYLAWRKLCAVRRNATPIRVQGFSVLRGGRRRAVLCSSPDVDSPSILGLGSPKLLLPDWMVPDLSETELHQIALHECEHLRRGDDWLNLLLQVAITLSPLNPALLWLNRSICVQRELAADAAVVAETAQPLSYAACLTRLAEDRRRRGRVRLALAAWERRSELAQRVHVLLDGSSRWTWNQSASASGGAVMALLLAASGMLYAPQFIHTGNRVAAAMTDQPSVVDVPVAQMSAVSPHAKTNSSQLVPVSFHASSRSLVAQPTKRRKSVVNATDRSRMPFLRGSRPQLVRTAAVLVQSRRAGLSRPTSTYGFHNQLTSAEFRTTYVAVPTRSGWLFIEL
ncbi:MAG: M56 family metallopeptidase [Janthinobacterium lividum]